MHHDKNTRRYAAGIIEDADEQYLIALPRGPENAARLWQFPRATLKPGESPEAGMRRIASEILGVTVEVIVGQPPIPAELDGTKGELRYFFCGIIEGMPALKHFAEVRWVTTGHLREYEFDAASQPVVDWLLEKAG